MILAILTVFDLVEDDRYGVKRITFVGVVLLLVFISAIRWQTGPDWDSYVNFYERIDEFLSGPALNFFEPGYTAINWAFSAMGAPYTAMLAFLAMITIGIKGIVFLRYPRILFLLLFLYYAYYLADIISVRQFTAVALCLFSLKYIEKRHFWCFLVTVLVATTIHVSSLFFIVAYWLYWVRLSDNLLYTGLILGFAMGLVDITSWLVNLVVSVVGVDASIADKVLRYDDEGLETSHANPYISYALGLLKRALILPVLIAGRRIIPGEDEGWYSGQLNLLVFGNIIYFVFVLNVPVITRLALPFLYMEIFLLASLVSSIKDIKLRILAVLFVIVFGALRLYMFMAPYWDLYVPFQTIFDKNHLLNRY